MEIRNTGAAGTVLAREALARLRSVADALERVHALQFAALLGDSYDPDELDRWLNTYQTAKRAAAQAQADWEHHQQAQRAQQSQPWQQGQHWQRPADVAVMVPVD